MGKCFACGGECGDRKGLTLYDYTFKTRFACKWCYPQFETREIYEAMKKIHPIVKWEG
jgi:hypothetical protein